MYIKYVCMYIYLSLSLRCMCIYIYVYIMHAGLNHDHYLVE